ncbi:MAG: cytochrome b [Hyphomicrobiaceae bacterium]
MANPDDATAISYSRMARFFHWLTVLLLLITVPVGMTMTYRGKELNLWDSTTNTLYSAHKLLGIVILGVVVLRLIYRLRHGAPQDEPSLSGVQRIVAHVVHWSLYGLLIIIPVVGWLGVSMFPALDVFGLFALPSLATPDKAGAELMFQLHDILGSVLLTLIAIHVTAALLHQFYFRDSVLRRMWPAKSR